VRAALLALLLSACGASAITTQARLDATLVVLTQQAAHVRDEARSAALDRVEAEHADDRAARNAALEAESHRWDASADALDALTASEHAWADAIQLAQTAGSEALLPLLLPTLGHLVQLYNAAARIAHDLGVELPAIPATITQLLAPQGGT